MNVIAAKYNQSFLKKAGSMTGLPEHVTSFEFYILDRQCYETVSAWFLEKTGKTLFHKQGYPDGSRHVSVKVDEKLAVQVFQQLLNWNRSGDDKLVYGCTFGVYF